MLKMPENKALFGQKNKSLKKSKKRLEKSLAKAYNSSRVLSYTTCQKLSLKQEEKPDDIRKKEVKIDNKSVDT